MTHFVLRMALVLLVAGLSMPPLCSQEPPSSTAKADTPTESVAPVITNESLPKGARIYVSPIQNGFETYIVAGLEKKKVPVVVVADRSKADYELTGCFRYR